MRLMCLLLNQYVWHEEPIPSTSPWTLMQEKVIELYLLARRSTGELYNVPVQDLVER